MKKVLGCLVIVLAFIMVTGCTKKEDEHPVDKSRSYQCVYNEDDDTKEIRRELIASVDETGKLITYNVIENENFTDEEAYKAACASKQEREDYFKEKNYENIDYYKVCSDSNLTVVVNLFYNVHVLTDAEKEEVKDLIKYVDKDNKFIGKNWMKEQENNKYKCS